MITETITILINKKNFKPIPIKISSFLERYNEMVSKKTFSLTINSKIRLLDDSN